MSRSPWTDRTQTIVWSQCAPRAEISPHFSAATCGKLGGGCGDVPPNESRTSIQLVDAHSLCLASWQNNFVSRWKKMDSHLTVRWRVTQVPPIFNSSRRDYADSIRTYTILTR